MKPPPPVVEAAAGRAAGRGRGGARAVSWPPPRERAGSGAAACDYAASFCFDTRRYCARYDRSGGTTSPPPGSGARISGRRR